MSEEVYCGTAGGVGESPGKIKPGDELAFVRIAVVTPVTLSKTSRVVLTLQNKD